MIENVLSSSAPFHVACARAEDFIDTLPDGCVSLITIDPPYFGVKDLDWDNAWPTPEAFIAWMGEVLAKCRRVLAPNGSIYVFAASQVRGGLTMATRVECEVARHFSVLTRIAWDKPISRADGADKDALRAPFPSSEAVIFAEQFGSDSVALGESQYGAKCDELRGFVFEPLRAYLDGERKRAGVPHRAVISALGMTGHDSHFFSQVQWKLPLPEQYAAMRRLFGGDHLARPYEALREQYEALREQYEALRRPFSVSATVPYTDVWTYATVNAYPGKHPCEKPFLMAENMIAASSRPGDLVADVFCGSGTFLAAAVHSGRRAVGCDMAPEWADFTRRRIESGPMQWRDFGRREGRRLRTATPAKPGQLDLFRSA